MKTLTVIRILFILLMPIEWLQAQSIGMRIPDTTVVEGNTIDLPIYADNSLTGQGIISYMLQITFDPSNLQPVSVITAGTISAQFGGSPAINTTVPGKVTLAGAGTAALTGSGKFIYIRFQAIQQGWIDLSFTGPQFNYFNEGTPAMTFDNGFVLIQTPPSINVFPNDGLIITGEQIQFNVNGGTWPYQWFVTNPSVATINNTGLLTATQYGFTKVVAQDNNGTRDTTNSLIEIRAMRLSIPDDLSQLQGTYIDVPVITTDLTGLGILSGTFSLGFDPDLLTPTGIVLDGTILAQYQGTPTVNFTIPGTASIGFAGTSFLEGGGVLIYVRFLVSLQNTGGTPVNFTDGLFNEGLLPLFDNGWFNTINLPVLSVSPNSGILVAGQTQQFIVNGGPVLPVSWSVNDPLVASVDQTGLVTAIQSGSFTVTATDNVGATASSDAWSVYDTRVNMPDTTVCEGFTQFYYPVKIEALPAGQSVIALEATITYNASYLSFLGVETDGTLTNGWSFVTNPISGQVILAGSGTVPFNSAGTLFKLKFGFDPSFSVGDIASLNLVNIQLNEGIPNPLVDAAGSILLVNTPVPGAASIVNGPGLVTQGQAGVSYIIPPVTNAEWYEWTLPPGATISSGAGTTSIIVDFLPDAVSGIIRVKGVNFCGTGVSSPDLYIDVVPTALSLKNVSVGTGQELCYNAVQIIYVAGGGTTFVVNNGGSATLIAGQSIFLRPGTTVYPGGYLHAYITSTGNFCSNSDIIAETGLLLLPDSSQDDRNTVNSGIARIYPNPVSDKFTVELLGDDPPESTRIEIFNMNGIRIKSFDIQGKVNYMDSSEGFISGIFLVKITTPEIVRILKMMKY